MFLEIAGSQRSIFIGRPLFGMEQSRKQTRVAEPATSLGETTADFRSPPLGQLIHQSANSTRFDFGDRHQLSAARTTPLLARDARPLFRQRSLRDRNHLIG